METVDIPEYAKRDVLLSENSRILVEKRYLRKDSDGRPIETINELLWRVAKHMASAEKQYGRKDWEIERFEREFFEMLTSFDFLPNSPTLMHAGTNFGQLAACYVLPIDDSLASITSMLEYATEIHKTGGGVGFSFSNIRPKNDFVSAKMSSASGPVAFLRGYSGFLNAIKQGGVRGGGNMGILKVDHPDIEEFISCKQEPGITNFNVSVGITDEFMSAVNNGGEFYLINPRGGEKMKIDAAGLFRKIAESAWKSAEPGLYFHDTVNKKNPTPHVGNLDSTNPCIAEGSLVSTNEGLIRIEKAHNPQHLLTMSSDYRPLKWTGKTGKKEVFSVKLDSGYEVLATADHRILTKNLGWKPVGDLNKSDEVTVLTGNKFGELSIDKEMALALGWLIGDGCISSRGNLLLFFNTKETQDIMQRIKPYLDDVNGRVTKPQAMISELKLSYSKKIAKMFMDLGAESCKAHQKTVPEKVFQMDKDSVKWFLSALFSADGSVQGTVKKGVSVRLSSTSLKLLKQVQVLLLQFGVYCKVYENRRGPRWKELPDSKRNMKKYYCQAEHELVISRKSMFRFMDEIGFCVSEKSKKFERVRPKSRGAYRDNIKFNVKSVEKVGFMDVYDVKEPSTSSFVANGMVVHNCGEVALLGYEACNLGSINLSNMVSESGVDWGRLSKTIKTAVRFLDNLIDVNRYNPKMPEVEQMVRGNRRIGLGVMGFADMLVKMGVRYDSEDGLKIAGDVMKFIFDEARRASSSLAEEKTVFPNYFGSVHVGDRKMRNCAVCSIAPTGNISIFAGCSQGIEPLYSIAYYATMSDGTRLKVVNKVFEEIARARGFYSDELIERIASGTQLKDIAEIPEDVRNLFVVAHDVGWEWHVRMQGAFQKYVDNAVSKTINMPADSTVDDVERAYKLAYELGCKGITVFRDSSIVGGQDTKGKIGDTPIGGSGDDGLGTSADIKSHKHSETPIGTNVIGTSSDTSDTEFESTRANVCLDCGPKKD